MKYNRPFWGIIGVCVLGYAFYQWCFPSSIEGEVHYITEPVVRGTVEKSVLAGGSVRAKQRIEVGAQVSGRIRKIYVNMGQAVKKGQLLAKIDADTQQNNLSIAQAELAAYQAQLEAKQVALNVAQSHFERMTKLLVQKSTSLNELEAAKNSLALAKAGVAEIQAKIQVAEMSLQTARTNLGYTDILAPIDGVVVAMPVSEGQTLNANQASPTIMQVADLSRMRVKLEIAEGDISQIQLGQSVIFNTLSEPNYNYHGRIESIEPALTKLSDSNYTEQSANSEAVYYYANILVDNDDQRLKIGMTVQAKVVIAEKKNVLIVPNTALKYHSGKSSVSILEQGKVIEKNVNLGLADSRYSEVINGLNEGERVVISQRHANEVVEQNNIRLPRF